VFYRVKEVRRTEYKLSMETTTDIRELTDRELYMNLATRWGIPPTGPLSAAVHLLLREWRRRHLKREKGKDDVWWLYTHHRAWHWREYEEGWKEYEKSRSE